MRRFTSILVLVWLIAFGLLGGEGYGQEVGNLIFHDWVFENPGGWESMLRETRKQGEIVSIEEAKWDDRGNLTYYKMMDCGQGAFEVANEFWYENDLDSTGKVIAARVFSEDSVSNDRNLIVELRFEYSEMGELTKLISYSAGIAVDCKLLDRFSSSTKRTVMWGACSGDRLGRKVFEYFVGGGEDFPYVAYFVTRDPFSSCPVTRIYQVPKAMGRSAMHVALCSETGTGVETLYLNHPKLRKILEGHLGADGYKVVSWVAKAEGQLHPGHSFKLRYLTLDTEGRYHNDRVVKYIVQ